MRPAHGTHVLFPIACSSNSKPHPRWRSTTRALICLPCDRRPNDTKVQLHSRYNNCLPALLTVPFRTCSRSGTPADLPTVHIYRHTKRLTCSAHGTPPYLQPARNPRRLAHGTHLVFPAHMVCGLVTPSIHLTAAQHHTAAQAVMWCDVSNSNR